jgi:ATP/ADP translocase
MKKIIYSLILTIGIISCSTSNINKTNEYEFVVEYTTTVTVGGFIGVYKRTFKVGEKYSATKESKDVITLRIAEHSELNDDCPNSWCYQELLDVPRKFLKLVN